MKDELHDQYGQAQVKFVSIFNMMDKHFFGMMDKYFCIHLSLDLGFLPQVFTLPLSMNLKVTTFVLKTKKKVWLICDVASYSRVIKTLLVHTTPEQCFGNTGWVTCVENYWSFGKLWKILCQYHLTRHWALPYWEGATELSNIKNNISTAVKAQYYDSWLWSSFPGRGVTQHLDVTVCF